MSEENMEIEPCVEPTNVCTSIDEFDKFHNGIVYEESEYITLSDILPPKPEVPELSSDIDDLDSVDVYKEFHNESLKEITPKQQHDNVSNHESVPQVSSTNPHEPVKKKRGRPSKKTVVDDAPLLLVSEQPKPSSNGIELETNISTDSNQNGRSKRLRKPKYIFDKECFTENLARNKTNNEGSRNDAQPTTKRRRGRPKKSNILETPPPPIEDTTEHEQLTEPAVEMQPSKRKKNSKKATPLSQTDDVVFTTNCKRPRRSKTAQNTELSTNVSNGHNISLLVEQNNETVEQETQNPKEKQLTDNDFTEIGESDLDDISLSQLKDSLDMNIEISTEKNNVETFPNKTESELENNVSEKNNLLQETMLSEDKNLTQGKPKRSRGKAKSYKYGSESEEDPFANVELSDDEPRRNKKGNKYYSDDEYVPGRKGYPEISSESEIEDLEEPERGRRKRSKVIKSPKKGCKPKTTDVNKALPTVATFVPSVETDDIEGQLQSSVILATDTGSNVIPGKWGTSEFESFLKKKISGTDLKIKKVNCTQSMESVKPPLEIPTIDPNEAKKYVETGSQTEKKNTAEKSVQTAANELVMAENIKLNNTQKAKACNFLESIVRTTAELGQLMTAKSQEFIEKKINIHNVTDTFKMDYCVKKSYLLFKLAKHNLMQMEEDLENNYAEFLKENNLAQYREQPKVVAPKPKESNSDSDCEIVEDKTAKGDKSKFNPKTVFLNKELSIKITKKPEAKNVKPNIKNIKGLKHTVWISDSVMVKKVKSNQSFLAQDSRTKKPPDSVLLDIVKNFFINFNRFKAVRLCAPYITRDWLIVKQDQICHYFFNKPDNVKVSLPTREPFEDFDTSNASSNQMNLNVFKLTYDTDKISPKTLFTLCIQILQNYTCSPYTTTQVELPIKDCKKFPKPLFKLCTEKLLRQINVIQIMNNNTVKINMNKEKVYNPDTLFVMSLNVLNAKQDLILNPVCSLKSICLHKVRSFYANETSTIESIVSDTEVSSADNYLSDIEVKKNYEEEINSEFLYENIELNYEPVFTLKALSLQKVRSLYLNVTSSMESVKDSTEVPSRNNLNCFCHSKVIINDEKVVSDFDLINGNMEPSIIPILHLKSIKSISNETLSTTNNLGFSAKNKKDFKSVLTLKSICLQRIKSSMGLATFSIENIEVTKLSSDHSSNENLDTENEEYLLNGSDSKDYNLVLTLKALALQKVKWLFQNITKTNLSLVSDTAGSEKNDLDWSSDILEENIEMELIDKPLVRSLFTLSVEAVQRLLKGSQHEYLKFTPSTLKEITLENIVNYFYPDIEDVLVTETNFTPINDDLSRSPTHNLKIISLKSELVNDGSQFSDDDNCALEDYEPDYDNCNDNELENEEIESKWVPQVQINNTVHESQYEIASNEIVEQPNITKIKIEPLEELSELTRNLPLIKSEPGLDQMTIIPESVVTTKQENIDNNERIPLTRQNSSSYDVDTFESFVRNNKMMRFLTDYDNQDTFTQSDLRIRQQHIPDYDTENDNNHSLLVPQTFEPFNMDVAKGRLMESSSSDNEERSKKTTKKKFERKGRGRHKRNVRKEKELFNAVVKNNDKPKTSVSEHISALTRKMKDKIRCEEKKTVSSESDYEDVPLSLRSEKAKQSTVTSKEIQCNNIDSTETYDTIKSKDEFNGFSALDQYGVSTYHKYAKYMYSKILEENAKPSVSENYKDTKEAGHSLEPSKIENETNNAASYSKTSDKTQKLNFVVRDGWNCYHIDRNDQKLYSTTSIKLQKLPEAFVDTYLQYQDLTDNEKEDVEINRLTNLQSLKRVPNFKAGRNKRKELKPDDKNSVQISDVSRSASPTFSIPAAELTPSDDEEVNVKNEPLPLVRKRDSENKQAKDSLMADHGSDSDGPLIQLKPVKLETNSGSQPSRRPGPKSKTKPVENAENLMLTADKMMNKELALLHAPVNLNEQVPEKHIKIEKTPKIASRKRSTRKRESLKNEEDSSSEEEKQWVRSKEKLLKRLVKKPEDTNVEDAKRAKMVSEFIEKRIDKPDSRIRTKKGKIRSRKKFLERQKQLKVLSNELYGDQDTTQKGKRSATYFKGRRNIRKVIDKKSLTKSTVTANMEELARKQRLITNQTLLREELGCDEDVNVLVINDEVCLEYDFEEHQPVVTVHPFFTKVMKAHQYEGVKFMWDACFESLKMIESGDLGGGCILAHCMGLGKTLQVLALLHTVLTHPRAAIRRVLVCCPLSTVLNWVDEIHKWIGPVTDQIKVFELSKLKKTYERAYQLEDWYNGGGIFIIGYELFRSLSTLDPYLDNIRPTIVKKIRTALLDPGPDIIVCDEGHLLKNDCSVLAVAMSRVATKRRIILTGTPMQNNLREYYCMVNFVKPNLLGTYSEYSNRFENPIMNGQHRDSVEADIKLMKARTHILHKVLEGCLQRQEASVLYPYLPKKHEYTVFISLTECQWKLYKHYLENYSKGQKKQGVLKDFHILQKVWTHPQVLHNFLMKPRVLTTTSTKVKAEKVEDDLALEDINAPEDIKVEPAVPWWIDYLDNGSLMETLESSHKMEAVFKILDECVAVGDKILIFSTSLYTMDTLEYFLKKIKQWNLGTDYYRLDGSVPAEVRQKWCREFNAENNYNTKLFLISTRAGSLGLNLVAANRVIILDTSWNPAHDIQSIFRIYRFGQKKDCYIYRLVALGTMEQKIYERSVTKQAVACRVVDEQQIDRHYNSADLTELYRYDEQGTSVVGGVALGVRDVVLLRVARAAAVHAVHEHDSLLRGSNEQALDETEREAVWHQFQQEHHHKQMQTAVPPPVSIHMPVKSPRAVEAQLTPSPSPAATPAPATPAPAPATPAAATPTPAPGPRLRGRTKRRRRSVEPAAVGKKDVSEEYDEGDSIQKNILIGKITNRLLLEDYHTKVGKKISEVVELVRDIVHNNDLKQISSNMDTIASALCLAMVSRTSEPRGTEPEKPVPEKSPPEKPKPKKRERGRPKKVLRGRPRKKNTVPKNDDEPTKRASEETASAGGDREDSEATVSCPASPLSPDCQLSTPLIERPANVTMPETPTPTKTTISTPLIECNEISLLSDDDEPSQPKVDTTVDDSKTTNLVTKVPLHRALLKNENFIKIVAHKYLSNNSSLDEDAAILAARYSTLKAYREIESTGKELYSGPLYAIAVEVLGINVLESLQEQGDKTKTKDPQTNVASKPGPRSKKSRMTAIVDNLRLQIKSAKVPSVEATPTKSTPLTKVTPPTKLTPSTKVTAPTVNKRVLTFPTKHQTQAGVEEVVPVGMFSRSNSVSAECGAARESESILPDDEEVPPPALRRHGSKPLLLNHVIAASKEAAATRPRPRPRPHKPRPEQILSDTICLDSDEEEMSRPPPPPPPAAGAPPVPVSLMAATPAALAAIPGVGRSPRLLPMTPPAPRLMLIPATHVQLSATASGAQMLRMLPPPRVPNVLYLDPRNSPATAPTTSAAANIEARPARDPTLPASHRIRIPSSVPTPGPTDRKPLATHETKLVKTICKPGDVFRINELGKVEILSRQNDAPAPKPAPTDANASSVKDPEPASVPDSTRMRQKRVDSISSSSSDDSRPATPDNPLSILRDVIHIQAVEEAPMQTTKLIKTSTSNKAAALGKASTALGKADAALNKTVTSNKAAKQPQTIPTLAEIRSKLKKINEKVFTNNDAKNNQTNLQSTKTVAGSSRSILIKSSGKTQQLPFPSVDLTDTSSVQVTKVQKLIPVNKSLSVNKPLKTYTKAKSTGSTIKANSKKRPIADTTEVPAKRPMTKKPMTLQDFNIDDFDDIIELE